MVYDELVGISSHDDELARWFRERRDTGLVTVPDTAVQATFRDIANFVASHYDRPNSERFLKGADPWVIAHARVQGGAVVTQETLVGANSRNVKIPNICAAVGVQYMNTYQMLRAMNATFYWQQVPPK